MAPCRRAPPAGGAACWAAAAGGGCAAGAPRAAAGAAAGCAAAGSGAGRRWCCDCSKHSRQHTSDMSCPGWPHVHAFAAPRCYPCSSIQPCCTPPGARPLHSQTRSWCICTHRRPYASPGCCAPVPRRRRRCLPFWLAHKQPVVHIPQRIRHERLALVVPPLAINNELVLVIPASKARGQGLWRRVCGPCQCRARAGMLQDGCRLAGHLGIRARGWMQCLKPRLRMLLWAGRSAAAAAPAAAHPGGRCTTTVKVPGCPSTVVIGTVSTHRVNDPHRCTCSGSKLPG